MTMELYGSPKSDWVLFASSNRVTPKATELGFLQLETEEATMVGARKLDRDGHATFTNL